LELQGTLFSCMHAGAHGSANGAQRVFPAGRWRASSFAGLDEKQSNTVFLTGRPLAARGPSAHASHSRTPTTAAPSTQEQHTLTRARRGVDGAHPGVVPLWRDAQERPPPGGYEGALTGPAAKHRPQSETPTSSPSHHASYRSHPSPDQHLHIHTAARTLPASTMSPAVTLCTSPGPPVSQTRASCQFARNLRGEGGVLKQSRCRGG